MQVNRCQQATLLSMAGVYLDQHEHWQAVDACTKVLARDPLCVTAMVRRAKAHMGRSDFKAAEADIAALQQLHTVSGMAEAAEELQAELRAAQARDAAAKRRLYRGMVSSSSSSAAKATR